MPLLTDLPDELILAIFASEFQDRHVHTQKEFAILMNDHILSNRIYQLAFQAFVETYEHTVDIGLIFDWSWRQIHWIGRANNGNEALEDTRWPNVSQRGREGESRQPFASWIQYLTIKAKVQDSCDRHMNRTILEICNKLEQYPELKKVKVELNVLDINTGQEAETMSKSQGLKGHSKKARPELEVIIIPVAERNILHGNYLSAHWSFE